MFKAKAINEIPETISFDDSSLKEIYFKPESEGNINEEYPDRLYLVGALISYHYPKNELGDIDKDVDQSKMIERKYMQGAITGAVVTNRLEVGTLYNLSEFQKKASQKGKDYWTFRAVICEDSEPGIEAYVKKGE